ncbi:hypothetical protein AB4Y84_11955, partial [Stenotrophomonas sp. 2YAF22]
MDLLAHPHGVDADVVAVDPRHAWMDACTHATTITDCANTAAIGASAHRKRIARYWDDLRDLGDFELILNAT